MLHRATAVFLCLILTLEIAGCGGGGGGGDSPAPGAPGGGPPAPPAIPPVPTGTPVVFLAVSADNTTFYPNFNITIGSDTQAILRYVPSTGALVQTDQNTSFSFATSTLRPLTWGDKLYSVNESNGVARFDLYPVSLQTNQRTNSGHFFPVAFPTGCIAVVGDDLIYRDSAAASWKKVAGLSAASLSPAPTTMGPAASPNHCTFNLGTANGRLFDVEFSDGAGATPDLFLIRERSTATGAVLAPNPLASFQESPNSSDFTNYLFAFDGNFMYMARRQVSTGQIQIFRWDPTVPNPGNTLPALRKSIIPAKPIEGPVLMDVRKGFIAMLVYTAPAPFTETRMITYNDTTQATPVDTVLGKGFYGLQVLFLP